MNGPEDEYDEATRAFAQGGRFGESLSRTDWSATALGPTRAWPPRLVEALRIVLTAEQPQALFWGLRYLMIYNEGYASIIGSKHPRALGSPAADTFPENWDKTTGPVFDEVVDRRQATFVSDSPFRLIRHGYLEQAYFDISYQPVFMDDGAVGGVLCVVSETTGRVLGERRLRLLAEIGSRTTALPDPRRLARAVTDVLAGNREDVPFAHLYLAAGRGEFELVASTFPDRSAQGPASSPPRSLLADGPARARAGIPADVLLRGAAEVVPAGPFLERPGVAGRPALADDPQGEPVAVQAVALPLSLGERVEGVLVAGVNPLLPLAGPYRDYLSVLAAAVTAALSAALAHQEQRRRAESLAELDRAKTAFFSNVSHELRTPLTLFLGPVQEALAQEDRPERREQLELAERNALRLLKLVNSLLDVTRAEAGRLAGVFEPVDLSRLTAELAGVFRSAFDRAGLRLEVDCPALPQPVHVDREMWEKIVLNLLGNALKFTLSGGAWVVTEAVGDRARLTVSDTGVGVPQEELPHLFERFHQVPGTQARTGEGSGIGLALVKDLVQQHGGTVAVGSREGGGTQFTVEIPFGTAHLPRRTAPAVPAAHATAASPSRQAAVYAEEALGWIAETSDVRGPEATPAAAGSRSGTREAATKPAAAADADAAGHAARQGPGPPWTADGTGPSPRPRLLVADDNADMRSYLCNLLRSEHDLRLVPDGRAALAAANAEPFDLVLTDAMMPGLDGFELVRALRADPRTARVPIVMLTARAGEEAAVQGLQAGADDYLAKPFSSRQLLARVRANLELARLRDRVLNEARENAAALAALSEAGLRLSGSLEPRQVVETAGDLLVPRLADEVHIHLAEPAANGPPGPAAYRAGQPVEPQEALADAAARVTQRGLHGSRRQEAASGKILALLLHSRGRVLGTLTAARRDRPFSQRECGYLDAVANRIALSYDNAARYQNERRLAVALQRALLPQQLPRAPGLATAWYYRASTTGAEVGGDWYDVIQLPDHRVGLAIGDVMGHDVDAAILMGRLRTALHGYSLNCSAPSEVLSKLDSYLRSLDTDRFTSCLYAVYEASGRLRYAAAGHPPPLLLAGDRTRFLPLRPGPPLGVSVQSAADHEAELIPGTGLLLFTDGLVEHHTSHLDERLAALRRECASLPASALGDPQRVIDRALRLLDVPGRADDDTALLAVVPEPRGVRTA